MAEAMDAGDNAPLQGVILCSTAISSESRNELASIAAQMGAQHRLDLTGDVTHLIVGKIATPKYRYVAKARPDIKVLHPEFLQEVRQGWMAGGDVDVAEAERKHAVGAFHGIKISVTGITDQDERTLFQQRVEAEGAVYSGDLTRDVTHLVAGSASGKKWEHARTWGLKIVSLKWVSDSLRRGMALDEELYDLNLPEHQQGRDAFVVERQQQRTRLGKRDRENDATPAEEPGKRKLRRTASSRLHSQSQDMWQDLASVTGASEAPSVDQWHENTDNERPKPIRIRSDSVKIRRSEAHESSFAESATLQDDSMPVDPPRPEGIFSYCSILIHGFSRSRTARLLTFLEPKGATICNDAAALENASVKVSRQRSFLLMPHTFECEPMPAPDVPPNTEVVTEWWVERCVFRKQFIDPAHDRLCRPFWDAHVPALEGVAISITGLLDHDRRQTALAVQLMGAAYEEQLSPTVTVLLSGPDTVRQAKAHYALKHNITVLSVDWLWRCLETKDKVDYEPYRVRIAAPTIEDLRGSRSPAPTASPASSGERQPLKDSTHSVRLSNTRRRIATPTLCLQASGPSVPPTKKPEPGAPCNAPSAASRRPSKGPFVFEDDEDDPPPARNTLPIEQPDVPGLPPTKARPLKERSPNASPRKQSQHADASSEKEKPAVVEPLSPTFPAPVLSPRSPRRSPPKQATVTAPSREELTASLHALVKGSSSGRPHTSSSELAQRRKHRPLGRSASGIGMRMLSGSARSEHARSPTPPLDASERPRKSTKEPEPPMGTQLGYETAEGERNRALIEKRMSEATSEKRVASVGVVKDSLGNSARTENGTVGRKGRNKTR